jgi:hypothetical protein
MVPEEIRFRYRTATRADDPPPGDVKLLFKFPKGATRSTVPFGAYYRQASTMTELPARADYRPSRDSWHAQQVQVTGFKPQFLREKSI